MTTKDWTSHSRRNIIDFAVAANWAQEIDRATEDLTATNGFDVITVQFDKRGSVRRATWAVPLHVGPGKVRKITGGAQGVIRCLLGRTKFITLDIEMRRNR
jgi:hypothetical protein